MQACPYVLLTVGDGFALRPELLRNTLRLAGYRVVWRGAVQAMAG